MNRQIACQALSLALLLGPFIGPALAGMIGINFYNGDSAYSMLPTDEPGIVGGGNWNNVTLNSNSGVALRDSTGTNVALLAFGGVQPSQFAPMQRPSTPNAATNKLYAAALHDFRGSLSASITNIPYKKYDVYVYADADGAADTFYVDNGSVTYYYRGAATLDSSQTTLIKTTSTSSSSPTVGFYQYQVFRQNSSSNFNLTLSPGNPQIGLNNLYGIQIVDVTVVPEPWTMTLFTATCILMPFRRGRRSNV